jgi:hypothetical protein
MKNAIYILCTGLILLAGCSNNPTQPFESITQKINDARPFKSIYISTDQGYFSYGSGSKSTSFNKAYAKNGYLIIVHSTNPKYGTHRKEYYNLMKATEVDLEPIDGSLSIIY